MNTHGISLRELYRITEGPGTSKLKEAQERLDFAVEKIYGITKQDNHLQFLLDLNSSIAEKEEAGKDVVGPGIPDWIEKDQLVTEDCVSLR